MGTSIVSAIQKIVTGDNSPVLDAKLRITATQVATPTNQDATKSKQTGEDHANISRQINQKLERIAKAIADYVQSIQRDLHIKIDDKTDQTVIQVISKKDGKVIRQVPPEELLKIAAKIEQMVGILLDKNA